MMAAGVKYVQVVDDDGDDEVMEDYDDESQPIDDDGDDEAAAAVAATTTAADPGPALLSKSWSVASAHVPTFTGGKVTPSYHVLETTTTATSPAAAITGENDDDENDTLPPPPKPFLLLPVHGDVAIVDVERGIKWGTLRTGADKNNGSGMTITNSNDSDDDDDEGVDHDDITSYALDSRNHTIVTCSRNNLLRQYSITYPIRDQGRCITQLVHTWGRSGHILPVQHMAFHPSNVFLATGSVDGTVRIWDVRGRYVTHVFRPLEGGEGGGSGRLSVTGLAWRPLMDQLVVAIARDDGSISIHDLRDKDDLDRVVVLRDHVSAVTCMEWWGDDLFLSTGRDAILNLWRVVETNEQQHPSNNSKDKKKSKAKKKSDPRTVVQNLPTITYRRIQTIPIYEQVEGMVLLPTTEDELQIVTAGSKGVLRYWKAHVRAGQTPELAPDGEQPSSQVFGEARGGYMGLALNHVAVAAGTLEEFLIAVDAEHNLTFVSSNLALNRTIVGHNDEILDMKIIPNTGSVVVATNSPLVRVFDLKNFSCAVLGGHTATVLCVDASPCGRYLASCGKDKTLRVWDSATHKCIGVATGHTEPIGACGLSQKAGKYEVGGKAARNGGGAFCVTASIDRTLKRWNLLGPEEWDGANDGEAVELLAALSIRGHEKDINIISVAPNDSLVASGSQDKTVKLWNSTDLTLKATLKGHRRGVWDCQFSPIDRVIATGSGDKTIKLWSLSDFSCVRTFQGHLSSVLRVRFLSTGLQMVSSGADGLIKLWTIRNNECEATLDGHSDKVWALDLAYGGGVSTKTDLLVSGGADSKIVVWADATAQLDAEERKQQAESILLDQQMANHLRHKEYDKALEIALRTEKPMHTMKVLTALLENEIAKQKPGLRKGTLKSTVLKTHVATWDLNRIALVLNYCREWNTRARNAPLAMWVVNSIVTTIPVDKLASKDATRTEHGSIPEILAGITPYAERHFDRLDRLYTSSYLLDFLLFNMSSFDPLGADDEDDEFAQWEATGKLVLPPKFVDGRIQVGGKALTGVGEKPGISRSMYDSDDSDADNDEVMTVGDSSTSSEEDAQANGYDSTSSSDN